MPKRIKELCRTPGCGGTAGPRGRCEHCQNRGNLAPSDDRSAYHAADGHFYSSANWRKARAAQLSRAPICQHCLAALATVVDHIIPRTQGGADLEAANLQSLCSSCHGRKTRAEQHPGRRPALPAPI